MVLGHGGWIWIQLQDSPCLCTPLFCAPFPLPCLILVMARCCGVMCCGTDHHAALSLLSCLGQQHDRGYCVTATLSTCVTV